MKKRITEHKYRYINITFALLFMTVYFLAIGFSAYQDSMDISNAMATVEAQKKVSITDATYSTADNGGVNSSYAHDDGSISGNITLPNSNSSVTYEVEITNLGSVEIGIASVTGLDSRLTYEFTNYKEGTKLCDDGNANICTLNSVTAVLMKIKYKQGATVTGSSISFNANFNFAATHNITYLNIAGTSNLQSTITHGGTLTVTFQTDIPDDVLVKDNNGSELSNYSYSTDTLTVAAVNSNITIDRYYLITYVTNNGTNDSDNPVKYVLNSNNPIADATRVDYIFDGWYLNGGFTGSKITSTSQLNGNVTLYAKFVLSITYDLVGGTQPNGQIYYFCETVSEPILDASRQYYVFDGWKDGQNTTVNNTSSLSFNNRSLTASWSPMVEKTNIAIANNNATFTANNISGEVSISNLMASSGSTYTYSGVNTTGSVITSVRVTLTYRKQTGKSESATCDVYRSYAVYQADSNHSAYLGTNTQTLSKGSNKTAQFNITLSGNNQIAEGEEFVILFSTVQTSSGGFTNIVIEFNV